MLLKDKLLKLFDLQNYKSLLPYAKGNWGSIFKIIFIKVIVSLISIGIALFTKWMIDFAMKGEIQSAILYGVVFAFLLCLELLSMAYASYLMVRVSEGMKNKLQSRLLEGLYNKKWLDLNQFKTGDLLTRLYNDIANVVNVFVSTIPELVALALQLVLAFSILCFYDPLLAGLTFLITPITIVVSMIIGKKIKAIQHMIQKADSLNRSIINESLQNIIILKTFMYAKHNVNLVKGLQNQHFLLMKKKNAVSIKSNIMLGAGYRFGFFGAFAFGAFRLTTDAISFGTFTAFLQLVGKIQAPIQGLTASLPQLVASMSSVERIDEMWELSNDYLGEATPLRDLRLPIKIHLTNIGFAYKPEHQIIKNLSLQIERGQKIAIVGPSGEGKTTLIHILLALMDVSEGTIEFEMENGERIPSGANTRSYFSYVPQNNALFSGSIMSNFLITEEIEYSKIENALIASCSKSFVDELPEGLHTPLGERGIGLSQGQAQRLTIARALIHNTPFLIFDEATSALDLETERALIENLKLYYPDTTLIAVTHRDSIFEICDRVYKLKNGCLHQA